MLFVQMYLYDNQILLINGKILIEKTIDTEERHILSSHETERKRKRLCVISFV